MLTNKKQKATVMNKLNLSKGVFADKEHNARMPQKESRKGPSAFGQRAQRAALYLSVLLCCLCAEVAKSQTFKWQAALDSIRAEGFYKVQLPPSITSKLRPDLTDIRILDVGSGLGGPIV